MMVGLWWDGGGKSGKGGNDGWKSGNDEGKTGNDGGKSGNDGGRSKGDTATGCGAYQGGLIQSTHHAPRNHTGSSERSKRFFCRDGGKQNRGR